MRVTLRPTLDDYADAATTLFMPFRRYAAA